MQRNSPGSTRTDSWESASVATPVRGFSYRTVTSMASSFGLTSTASPCRGLGVTARSRVAGCRAGRLRTPGELRGVLEDDHRVVSEQLEQPVLGRQQHERRARVGVEVLMDGVLGHI